MHIAMADTHPPGKRLRDAARAAPRPREYRCPNPGCNKLLFKGIGINGIIFEWCSRCREQIIFVIHAQDAA